MRRNKLIIISENAFESYKLLEAIKCPEEKDCEECDGVHVKKYENCWECFSKTYGITFKFAELSQKVYTP